MAIPRYRYHQKKQRRKTSPLGSKKFKQGYYTPQNPEKYKQPLDSTMNSGNLPFYRSSWELKFYEWCDMSSKVEMWGVEVLHIKYLSPKDNRMHRYFPDVFVKFIDGRRIIIEIKPLSQIKTPINLAKFESARQYCDLAGIEFMVMTEKDLGIK